MGILVMVMDCVYRCSFGQKYVMIFMMRLH